MYISGELIFNGTKVGTKSIFDISNPKKTNIIGTRISQNNNALSLLKY